MASARRKSAAIALAVVGVAGLSLASAATLSVNSASLGAGTTTVASCDADGVRVDFATALGATGYQANEVTVSGIADTCVGQQIRVTVKAGTTLVLNDASATIATGETSKSFTFAASDASAIDNVAVVIAG